MRKLKSFVWSCGCDVISTSEVGCFQLCAYLQITVSLISLKIVTLKLSMQTIHPLQVITYFSSIGDRNFSEDTSHLLPIENIMEYINARLFFNFVTLKALLGQGSGKN